MAFMKVCPPCQYIGQPPAKTSWSNAKDPPLLMALTAIVLYTPNVPPTGVALQNPASFRASVALPPCKKQRHRETPMSSRKFSHSLLPHCCLPVMGSK